MTDAEIIAELFGSPCDYGSLGEEMCANCDCEHLCGTPEQTDAKCWQMYFELRRKKESKYLEKSDYDFIKNCFENKQCYNCGLRKECEREHPDTYQPIGTCSKWTKE